MEYLGQFFFESEDDLCKSLAMLPSYFAYRVEKLETLGIMLMVFGNPHYQCELATWSYEVFGVGGSNE